MATPDFQCFDPDRPSGWDESDFAEFVRIHFCQFAKTMPENPHEYTLRRNTKSRTFNRAVRYIRERGVVEYFAGWPYKTLYFGDHKFWTRA